MRLPCSCPTKRDNTNLVYGTMISSEGNYTLRFTGNVEDIVGVKSVVEMEADYLEYFDERYEGNPERALLHFLEDIVKINGVNLYEIKDNGDVEHKTLKENGKVDSNDCER